MQQVLETIMSVFTKTTTEHVPEYADITRVQQESPCDYICRTNPFLFAYSG
jgi:hypothetical protein